MLLSHRGSGPRVARRGRRIRSSRGQRREPTDQGDGRRRRQRGRLARQLCDRLRSHLGNFTRHEDVTFGPAGTIAGTIVFVAADGDELYVDFTGQFVSPNDAVASYTFNGGTGRFSNATGTAQATASTPDFVHVSVSFEGTIDY